MDKGQLQSWQKQKASSCLARYLLEVARSGELEENTELEEEAF